MKDDKHNILLAMLLSALILLGWPIIQQKVFPGTLPPKPVAQQGAVVGGATPGSAAPGSAPALTGASAVIGVDQALTGGQRVAIATPRLQGSINLVGGRIDDLTLTQYRQTVDKGAPPVRLFTPVGTAAAYYAGQGWTGQNIAVPDAQTVWTADGTTLTPTTPVTLTWDNGQGQRFAITYAIDDKYLVTVKQTVANSGSTPITVTPYSYIDRRGKSPDLDTWTIHVGPMGVFNDAADYGPNWGDLDKAGAAGIAKTSTGGWVGFTDKYWLGAVIPDQRAKVNATFRSDGAATPLYQANFAAAPLTVAPGMAMTSTSMVFAGAKETALLDAYTAQGIAKLDHATDWGWFYWFEKPIFALLHKLFELVGNFGIAIILLTFLIRALVFPIAQKQYHSMAHMRLIQPKMKALQDKYKQDPQRLQQETMKLYREEKVNPFMGCVPILIQMPILYGLYKVLSLSIEMRHQPFFGWLRDLSAPDPAHLLNLFGLLPFNVPGFLGIGVLGVLLGFSMWLQFRLQPKQGDATQQQVMALMPWIMMFAMGSAASGLLIYWITSNLLTIVQMKWLYSKYPQLKEPVPGGGFGALFGDKRATAGAGSDVIIDAKPQQKSSPADKKPRS